MTPQITKEKCPKHEKELTFAGISYGYNMNNPNDYIEKYICGIDGCIYRLEISN